MLRPEKIVPPKNEQPWMKEARLDLFDAGRVMRASDAKGNEYTIVSLFAETDPPFFPRYHMSEKDKMNDDKVVVFDAKGDHVGDGAFDTLQEALDHIGAI